MAWGNKGLLVLLNFVLLDSITGQITLEKISGPSEAIEGTTETFTCSATCPAGCTYIMKNGSTTVGSSNSFTTTLRRPSPLNLTCTISSNGTSKSVSHSVNILYGPDDMTAPPQFTLTENDPISTSKSIVCQAKNCNPTCHVTWKKGNDIVATNQLNSLTWVGWPKNEMIIKQQAGTYICSVENPKIPGNILERPTEIIVQYKPDVTLNWDADNSKFTCIANGNPNTYKYTLVQFVNSKFVKNYSLPSSGDKAVLEITKPSYKNTGHYECSAENTVGSGKATTNVSIEDQPLSFDWKNSHNVSKGDPLVLTAKIYAIPRIINEKVSISYKNTTDFIDITKNVTVNIANDQCSVDFGVTVQTSCQKVQIRFEEMAEEFFGPIQVKISNTKGTVSLDGDINPKGPPDVPKGFRVSDLEHESVKFVLKSGFFNGASQTFVVEMRRADNSSEWSNESTVFVGPNKGVFRDISVSGLTPDTRYKARAYAVNIYNRSDYTELIYLTTMEEPMKAGAIAGIVIGTLFALVLLLIAGYFVFRWRRKPKEAPETLSRVLMPEIINRESAVVYQNTEIGTFSGTTVDEGIYVNQLVSSNDNTSDEAVASGLSPTKQEEGIYVNMAEKKTKSKVNNIPLYLDIQAANDASSESEIPYMNLSPTKVMSPGESDYLDMEVNNRENSKQNENEDYQNVSQLKKNGSPPKKSSKEETVIRTKDRDSIPQYVAPLPPPNVQSPGSEKNYMNIQFS